MRPVGDPKAIQVATNSLTSVGEVIHELWTLVELSPDINKPILVVGHQQTAPG